MTEVEETSPGRDPGPVPESVTVTLAGNPLQVLWELIRRYGGTVKEVVIAALYVMEEQ